MITTFAINAEGRRIGDSHHHAKLTNGEVELILQLHESGLGYKRIAIKMEVSKSQIRNIILGRKRCQSPHAFKVVHIRES